MGKFNKQFSSFENDSDLSFTKEDMELTLKKIKDNQHRKQRNSFSRIGKLYVGPLLGTVMVAILAVGILIPNVYLNNEISQEGSNKKQATQQENLTFSALVMGKNSTTNRSNINILITYNSNSNSLKLVPIPRDTYVETFNSEGQMIGNGKVMNAIALESTPKPAMTTVSNLFNLTVDYYFVIPEEKIYADLEIDKDDPRINQNQTNEIGKLLKEHLSLTEVKNLLKESESNIPRDFFNKIPMEKSNSESIHVIDVAEEGIEETFINSIYYVKINQEVIDSTTDILKKHLDDEE